MQQAYKLDFINDMADSIGKSIQTLAGAVSYTHLDVYKRQIHFPMPLSVVVLAVERPIFC